MTTNQKIHEALNKCWHEPEEVLEEDEHGEYMVTRCKKCGEQCYNYDRPNLDENSNPLYDQSFNLLMKAARDIIQCLTYIGFKYTDVITCTVVVYTHGNGDLTEEFMYIEAAETPQEALTNALLAYIERGK